jgi:hypothetical protein
MKLQKVFFRNLQVLLQPLPCFAQQSHIGKIYPEISQPKEVHLSATGAISIISEILPISF